jgi:hypothetical protein
VEGGFASRRPIDEEVATPRAAGLIAVPTSRARAAPAVEGPCFSLGARSHRQRPARNTRSAWPVCGSRSSPRVRQGPGRHPGRPRHGADPHGSSGGLRYGMCPHHLLPYRGVTHVAYIPARQACCGFGRIAELVERPRAAHAAGARDHQVAEAPVTPGGAAQGASSKPSTCASRSRARSTTNRASSRAPSGRDARAGRLGAPRRQPTSEGVAMTATAPDVGETEARGRSPSGARVAVVTGARAASTRRGRGPVRRAVVAGCALHAAPGGCLRRAQPRRRRALAEDAAPPGALDILVINAGTAARARLDEPPSRRGTTSSTPTSRARSS